MSVLTFHSSPGFHNARPQSFLNRWWTDAVQAWRYHQADRAMYGLSDEMLHDIGIARSEIEDATRHGRPAGHWPHPGGFIGP